MSLFILISSSSSNVLVTVKGSVDTKTAPQLMDRLLEISLGSLEELRLNFADVEFLSSSGLRVLLFARQKMPHESRLVLESASSQIKETILNTGLDQALLFEP